MSSKCIFSPMAWALRCGVTELHNVVGMDNRRRVGTVHLLPTSICLGYFNVRKRRIGKMGRGARVSRVFGQDASFCAFSLYLQINLNILSHTHF